ncbi:MAG: PTS sugar transporter subunit IIC [Deltaproteobacteria bacterium]|nr:PTS sugar transporter subunit IIC [Deltaproteobacteria bacterium]
MTRLVLAAAVGGLLTVERRAFLQAGLSRPLVASALLGACLGQLPAGLLVGAPLELLFLGSASLGAVLPEHETLAACAVSAASAQAAATLGALSIPASCLALLALLPLAVVGRKVDALENRVQQRYADRAMQFVEQRQYRKALRMNWRGLGFPFGGGALTTAIGLGVGYGLAVLVPKLPVRAGPALTTSFVFAAAICAAAGVRGTRHPRGIALALVSAVVTLGAVLWGG